MVRMTRTGGITVLDRDGRRKYLTKNEGVRFLRAAAKQQEAKRLLCLTIFYTGCRISEALSLTLDDVDRDAAVIRILCLKKRDKRVFRRVPIPPFLVKELLQFGGVETSNKLWTFCRETGWRAVKATMREANIDGIHSSPKALRHGFGIRAATQRIPVTQIQQWLGHSSILTTQVYLDFKGDEERELIKRTWDGA